MNSSFKLPAISARKAADPPAGQQLLQAALAKVTAEAVEAIVRQIVEEAQAGTIAERRNARQLLFGLLGQKPPGAQSPSYVQNNHYYGPRTKGRCRVCGRPVKPGTGSGGICQACIDGPRPGDPTPEEIAAGKAERRKRNGHATAGADLS